MRLIDEDVLIENIVSLGDLRRLSTATIGEALKKCSTVEAEPVRHGKWIKTEWRAICSECGEAGSIFDEPVNPFNYCPFCGAKMDGD